MKKLLLIALLALLLASCSDSPYVKKASDNSLIIRLKGSSEITQTYANGVERDKAYDTLVMVFKEVSR